MFHSAAQLSFNTIFAPAKTVLNKTYLAIKALERQAETDINERRNGLKKGFVISTVVPCILIVSKFYYRLMHKRTALKVVSKSTLKQLQHVSV